jgi:putative flippase GtrA
MKPSFSKFALVSGTGWLIDVVLTAGLVRLGTTPFLASLSGSIIAVTFVYVVSLRAVFSVGGRLGARALPFYVIWQVFSISGSAWLVAFLTHLIAPWLAALAASVSWIELAHPLAAASGIGKALATPITLAANFLFFSRLTSWLRTSHPSVSK